MQYNKRPSYKCLIVTLFAFLGIVFPSKAQSQDDFMHIDIEEMGFPKGSVSCIMQDSRGFLWIGTTKAPDGQPGSSATVCNVNIRYNPAVSP